MYKYENDMLPELFKDMFKKVTNVHDHDTRNATTDQLYIPIYGTVRGQKSFNYAGVRTRYLQIINAQIVRGMSGKWYWMFVLNQENASTQCWITNPN